MSKINLSTFINGNLTDNKNLEVKGKEKNTEFAENNLFKELESAIVEEKKDSMLNFVPRSIKEELQEKVKTTLFGGYKKSSVQSYVSELKDNLDALKVNLEQQIKDLASEKLSLYQECSLLHSQLVESEGQLQKLGESENLTQEKDNIIQGLEERNKSLLEEKSKIEVQYEEISSKLKEEGAGLEMDSTALLKKEEELARLNEEYKLLEDRYNDLSLERSKVVEDTSKDEELAALRKEYEFLKGRYDALNSRGGEEAKIMELESDILNLKSQLQEEKIKNLDINQKYMSILDRNEVQSSLVEVYDKSLDKYYLNNNEVMDKIYMQMKTQSDAFLHVIAKLDKDLVKIDALRKEKQELESKNELLLLDIEKLKGKKSR